MTIFVNDQSKALKFYTKILGFIKKHAISVGEFRWLTVVSAQNLTGTELLLEPNSNSVVQTYQTGIFTQGIATTLFGIKDINAEYQRVEVLLKL